MPVFLKEFIDSLLNPTVYVSLGIVGFVLMLVTYRTWTKPAVALSLLGVVVLFFGLSWSDPNFNEVVTKPDNIPIVALVFILGFFTWLALRQAAINDERIERGEPPREATEANDRILVWPDLVYQELICMVLFTVLLIVWSVFIPAPLEEPANLGRTPNPSKAPWYFLGLQEMLVYFDPWIAGVLLPGMIISGLILVPYCDKNPKGVGYYTLKERPFAIFMYLFGFVVLWVVLIVLGMLLFGPDKLPKMIQDVASFIRKVRSFSDSARDDIRREMGPEFKDFEFQDLNPKRFAQKHIMENDDLGIKELRESFDLRKELTDVSDAVNIHKNGEPDSSPAAGASESAKLTKTPDLTKPVNGSKPVDGGVKADTPPPFDPDAT